MQAMDQRSKDAHNHLVAGDMIGMPKLRRDRWQIIMLRWIRVVAAIHHDPAQRQMNQVRCLVILPGPFIAEGRHARGDQAGELRGDVARGDTQSRCCPPLARIKVDIGGGKKFAEILLAIRRFEVEHDGTLAAIIAPEMQRTLGTGFIIQEGSDGTGGRALRGFHLDDLSAEASECHANIFGCLIGQFHNTQPLQHARQMPGLIAREGQDARRSRHAEVSLRRVMHGGAVDPRTTSSSGSSSGMAKSCPLMRASR